MMSVLKPIGAPRFAFTVRILILAQLLVVLTFACIAEDDLTIDQREYQLSQQLMCPVCDGQTLDQSQAQISEDMKSVIRARLEAGESNQDIRDYFVQRYGEVVLAAPTSTGFNVVAWVMPFLIFVGGMLVVGNALRRMRAATPGDVAPHQEEIDVGDESPADEDDLSEYLERVDSEIAALSRSVPDPNAEREQ